MTTAIDFNAPATTDNYSTAFVPKLQANLQSLGMWLDSALVTSTNTPNGTKRFNSTSGLFEQYSTSGAAWAALATGYAKSAGDTFTGAMTFTNNVALQWKDLAGTARNVLKWKNTATDLYFGDIDNVVTGSVVHVTAQGSLSFEINSSVAGILSASGMTVQNNSGVSFIANAPASSEGFRIQHASGFFSGYNTAGSTRTGYLQFNAATSVLLFAENGASLQFGAGGSVRYRIDTAGWHSFLTSNSAAATTSTWGGSTAVFGPNATTTTGAAFGIGYNTTLDQAELIALAPGAAWKTMNLFASQFKFTTSGSIVAMLLDGSGNITAAGNITATGGQLSLGSVPVIGTDASDTYFRGVNIWFQNQNATKNFALMNSNGVTQFFGGVVTPPATPVTTSGAVTLDCSKSNVFQITLNGNMTGLTLSNISDGQTLNVWILQDGSGSHTMAGLTSANGYIWPGGTVGVLSTAASARDLLCITYNATIGKAVCTLAKGLA